MVIECVEDIVSADCFSYVFMLCRMIMIDCTMYRTHNLMDKA